MKKKILLPFLLSAFALPAIMNAAELTRTELSFNISNRTTATANTVNVTSEYEGVTAQISSLTNNGQSIGLLSAASTSTILIPNVNANTSPDIKLELEIEGLPTNASVNSVDLHIWAYNGQGGTQDPNDGVERFWTVTVDLNDVEFADFGTFDIAAGVTGANKDWNGQGDDTTVTNPLKLTVNISASQAQNRGCFFGLESITLNPEVEPATSGTTDGIFGEYNVFFSWDYYAQAQEPENLTVTFAQGATENEVLIQGLFPEIEDAVLKANFNADDNTLKISAGQTVAEGYTLQFLDIINYAYIPSGALDCTITDEGLIEFPSTYTLLVMEGKSERYGYDYLQFAPANATALPVGVHFLAGDINYTVTDNVANSVEMSEGMLLDYGDGFTEWMSYLNYYVEGEVTIPSTVSFRGADYSVTGLGNGTLADGFIESLVLPNTVTTIGDFALFYQGFGEFMQGVDLGSGVTYIGEEAFAFNSILETVINRSATPAKLGEYAFLGISDEATLYVPKSAVETYEKSEWSQYFAYIVGLDDDTTAVNTISKDSNADETIYNLQGVRVNRSNISSGLYIVNGKKVIIRK